MPGEVGALTSAPLGGAGTFTSQWLQVHYVDITTYTKMPSPFEKSRYICGIAFSDQVGTLFVEQSNDGATVHFQEPLAVGAGLAGALAYNRRLYGAFVRVRYVNGAAPQAVFSLTAFLVEEG